VDLFAGCGGLTLGVAEACRAVGRGLEVRLAVEKEAAVRAVYDANFHSVLHSARSNVFERFDHPCGRSVSFAERATAKQVGAVDLLVGGPPCQGHSDLNNHTRRRDPKNELYMVMVRAAEVLQPSHIMIENVHGVRRDHSGILARAFDALDRLRYRVSDGLVHVAGIGVPQRRVRHIVVASRRTEPSIETALSRAALETPRTLRWAIEDLRMVDRTSEFDTPGELSKDNFARAKFLLRSDRYDLPNSMRPACHRDNPSHRYTAMYGRLRWDEPAHTITTGFGSPGQGTYFHPEEPRTLTPHEAARLQFFPDWFDFSAAVHRFMLAHCIGNAVPSKLAFVLAVDMLIRERSASAGAQATTLGP
jgi:DNA (cytosine-5)-methyltransferase 1